jgi:tetratricopeptide (TPR) repeat protein
MPRQKVTPLMLHNPKPLSSTKVQLQTSMNRIFSIAEYKAIQLGFLSGDMNDHWSVYWDNDCLFFYRSWSGSCMYEVFFKTHAGGYSLSEVWFNPDLLQNNEGDTEYHQTLIFSLIDELLLQKHQSQALLSSAHTITTRIDDPPLIDKAREYGNLGRYTEAIKVYEQYLSWAQSHNVPIDRAFIVEQVGDMYVLAQNHVAAQKCYEYALQHGDQRAKITCSWKLGKLLAITSEHQRAYSLMQYAFPYVKSTRLTTEQDILLMEELKRSLER